MNIGWIGTGNMGLGMAKRLIKGGCRLKVYNRTREKAQELADTGMAELADSPAEVFAECDIVFASILNDSVWDEMLPGVLPVLRYGTTVIEMSTLSPEYSGRLRSVINERGGYYADAPVIGSMFMIEPGLLKVIVSGDRQAYDTALPYLNMIGKSADYIGTDLQARYMKIAVNMVICSYLTIYGEALLAGESLGHGWRELNDMLENCDGSSAMLVDRGTLHAGRIWGGPTATTTIAMKDLSLALRCAAGKGFGLPLTSVVCQYDRFMHYNHKYKEYSTFGTIGVLEDICSTNPKMINGEENKGQSAANASAAGLTPGRLNSITDEEIREWKLKRAVKSAEIMRLQNALTAVTTLMSAEAARFCAAFGIEKEWVRAFIGTCHGATEYVKKVYAGYDGGLTIADAAGDLDYILEKAGEQGAFLPIMGLAATRIREAARTAAADGADGARIENMRLGALL